VNSRLMSIIVPVFNEQDSLEALTREIREVAEKNDYRIEIVFVDDGSSDDSWPTICRLAGGDPSIGGLRFSRNSGKAAALMAGFAAVRGELVFTMDADLQDPPQEMPRLAEKIDAGFDVVSGWKRHRLDPWHKVYPSRIFNKMIGWFTGVHLHDHVCGLKCYRRKVLADLDVYGELHRFLAVFADYHGHRVTEIPTLHRRRTIGVGKYGFSRFIKGFLDLLSVTMLTRFRWRPQHLIGTLAIVGVLLNLITWFLLMKPVRKAAPWLYEPLWEIWSSLAQPLLIIWSGMALIAIGLVAELIIAEHPRDKLYEITERAGWCEDKRDP